MKKLMSTIGIVALLAGTSFAQEHVKHDVAAECTKGRAQATPAKHRKRADLYASIPDLKEEQKTQMQKIKKTSRESMKEQHDQLRMVHKKLGAAKRSEEPNMEDINSLIDEMHKLKAEIDKAKTASHIRAMSVLTPEQRKAFNENMEKKHAEREKMRNERKEMKKAK
ncbi:MAG: Spy/CpxP family protein refolding chaperone [Flavobacteriales bacterium]